MARKIFQDFANTLPHMLVGWRMQEDLEILANLPDGTLTIDVLAGRASHTSAPELALWITGEMHAWLHHRLVQHGVAHDDLHQAIVVAHIRTDRITTDRKEIVSFDFQCDSSLMSGPRAYRGSLTEKHVWHKRLKR